MEFLMYFFCWSLQIIKRTLWWSLVVVYSNSNNIHHHHHHHHYMTMMMIMLNLVVHWYTALIFFCLCYCNADVCIVFLVGGWGLICQWSWCQGKIGLWSVVFATRSQGNICYYWGCVIKSSQTHAAFKFTFTCCLSMICRTKCWCL